MAQPSVVVVFTSRCGATETLAHAAAIGTVNARTLPRLRRLPDEAPASAACADTLRRLQREYVPPTEADIVTSEGLVLVPSAGMTPASTAWAPFFALLDRVAVSGRLAGKALAVVEVNDGQTMTTFLAALSSIGANVIPSDGRDARTHGRAVGEAVLGGGQRAS